jgi:hypothetical protein
MPSAQEASGAPCATRPSLASTAAGAPVRALLLRNSTERVGSGRHRSSVEGPLGESMAPSADDSAPWPMGSGRQLCRCELVPLLTAAPRHQVTWQARGFGWTPVVHNCAAAKDLRTLPLEAEGCGCTTLTNLRHSADAYIVKSSVSVNYRLLQVIQSLQDLPYQMQRHFRWQNHIQRARQVGQWTCSHCELGSQSRVLL